MNDIKIKRDGDKLVITANVSKGRESKSGKSKVYASTHGFIRTQSGFSVNLNVIKTK